MSRVPNPCVGNSLLEKLRNNPEAIECGDREFPLTGKQWMMAVATMKEAADEIELLQNEAEETLAMLEKATNSVRRPLGERVALKKIVSFLKGNRK